MVTAAFGRRSPTAPSALCRSPGMPFAREGGGWYPGPAPFLGEHNEEVLGKELGLNTDDLDRLREANVIGTRPLGLD